MPIQLEPKDIVTVPATPATTASLMWINSMSFNFPGPTQEGSMYIQYYPMTTDHKVIRQIDGADKSQYVSSNTMYADMGECPELAAAFGAVLVAVPAYIKIVNKKAEDAAKLVEEARLAAVKAEYDRVKAEYDAANVGGAN